MISELLLKSGEPSLDMDKRSKVQSCHQVLLRSDHFDLPGDMGVKNLTSTCYLK